ncbi:phosphoserine phosphatase-like [Acropora millepora]|uniref:phosphoserine phosphatase-like n=1 Tax=Acropora millepora TaxID=45264 RepID=UPI001CF1F17B|nr:phosphoserine phosphatase-like [Acropora millepora]
MTFHPGIKSDLREAFYASSTFLIGEELYPRIVSPPYGEWFGLHSQGDSSLDSSTLNKLSSRKDAKGTKFLEEDRKGQVKATIKNRSPAAQLLHWTARAMGGGISFRTALSERLSIINVSKEELHSFIENNPPRLTPGIRELVAALHKQGTDVYLISGGFKRIIQHAAEQLQIPAENIFANRLLFDDEGCFAGFDKSEPTSESGGKTRVVKHLKTKFGYKK